MNSKECSMQMGLLNIHEGKERKVKPDETAATFTSVKVSKNVSSQKNGPPGFNTLRLNLG